MRRFVWVLLLVWFAVPFGFAQTAAQDKNPSTVPAPKKKPDARQSVKFSFTIVSAEKEEAVPDSIRVEGLTNEGVRYVLSCPFGLPRPSLDQFKAAQNDAHMASQDHKLPTLSIYSQDEPIGDGPPGWNKVFVVCMILNRVARAKDVFIVRVVSSESGNRKEGPGYKPGYKVEANGSDKSFRLECTKGGGPGAPCVNLRPGNYRAIRDGSNLRLCDADLIVISRYTIISEHPGA